MEIKKEFGKYSLKIDSRNINELKEFFKQHDDYTSFEISAKYGIPVWTLSYWRRKCGITRKIPKFFVHGIKREKTQKIENLDWDNPDWLRDMYHNKGYGFVILSKMTGKSIDTLYSRFKRYEIPTRSKKQATFSKNPYCNEEWLFRNYISQRKSAKQCAKEAGVSEYTIYRWLALFQHVLRTRNEASYFSNIRVAKRNGTKLSCFKKKLGRFWVGQKSNPSL
jgi:hypothetical protein